MPMTRKDNLMVWGGVFLPRLLANASIIACCSLRASKKQNQFPPNLMYFSLAHLAVNAMFIMTWVNPKLFTTKRLGNGQTPTAIFTERTLFMMSLVMAFGQAITLTKSTHQYSDLTIFIVVSTVLMEGLHFFLVPAAWKFDPHLQDIFWQNFYVLMVFLLDVVYICFISHLLTQGYVKFKMGYSRKG